MDILLVRHAIAERRDAERWPDDSLRPLTPEGERRFRAAARGLARLAAEVDVVLASPYARAWRTAELLSEEARWPAARPSPELGSDREPGAGLTALEGVDGDRVALVGHEPNLSRLASLLLTGREDEVSFELKKGGAVLLSADGPAAGGGALLLAALPPRLLRALS